MLYVIVYILIAVLGEIVAGIYCTANNVRGDDQFFTCAMAFAWPLIVPAFAIFGICWCLYKFGEWIWDKYQVIKLRHE